MFWIMCEQRLVAAYSGVVVNVTGLGHAHNGMDQQVGLMLLDCPQCKLIMRPVHGVSGLKSDYISPSQAAELVTKVSRGQA